MKITAEPRSDQWNASDFIGGPRTFTIAGVKVGAAEQKYDIELVEGEGRVWRPPLTMLRLLMKVWATDEADKWAGRRVTLFNDEKVRFGKDETGGIRVSHVSHIAKRETVTLPVSRGRVDKFTVDPLPELTRKEQLAAEWRIADPDRRAAIEAEVATIRGESA